MYNHKHIQVTGPCSQNWDKMSAALQGRFCSHCSKTVIDFTQLTDQQVINRLEEYPGGLCGRFNNNQLDRALITSKNAPSRNKLREIFAALLLLVTVKEVSAGTKPNQPLTYMQPDVKAIKPSPDKTDTSAVTLLNGRVISSKTRGPVAFAVIENISKQITTSTAKAGRFQISASVGDTIRISYPGYEQSVFSLTDMTFKSYPLDSLNLEPMVPVMGIVRYDYKP